LQNKILTQNFSKKLNFKIEDNVPAAYKEKNMKKYCFAFLKVVGNEK
jgi:hypothetical protein